MRVYIDFNLRDSIFSDQPTHCTHRRYGWMDDGCDVIFCTCVSYLHSLLSSLVFYWSLLLGIFDIWRKKGTFQLTSGSPRKSTVRWVLISTGLYIKNMDGNVRKNCTEIGNQVTSFRPWFWLTQVSHKNGTLSQIGAVQGITSITEFHQFQWWDRSPSPQWTIHHSEVKRRRTDAQRTLCRHN